MKAGSPAWSAYIRFDHTHPIAGNVELRRALAHAIDREALAAVCPANLVVASGGVVPPALQGHTPDIALRYDPDIARACLERSGFDGPIELAGMMVWDEILDVIAGGWREVFGERVTAASWSWREEEAIGIACDVADESQVADAVDRAVETYGRLDMAFNNAGVQAPPSDAADVAAAACVWCVESAGSACAATGATGATGATARARARASGRMGDRLSGPETRKLCRIYEAKVDEVA